MPPTTSTRLIVGIDFGTTFSGVAYALVRENSRPNNISVISQWRGVRQLGSYERVKVPTKIWYKPSGDILWGYEVPEEGDPIEWFKLLLVEESDLNEKLRNSPNIQTPRDKLKVLKKDVTTVVADYLRLLWKYALDQMERELQTVAEIAPLTVILTVPAIWPENARKKMLEAANLAGICDDRLSGKTVVSLVTEPEAAAIATICTVVPERPDVQPGDSMVILDIGGGTADAISYVIDEVKPFPKFREVVEGDGSFHGAKILDRQFEDYIKMYIGLQNWEKYTKYHRRILEESWEYSIKPSFDNTDRQWVVDTIIDGKVDLNKKQIADCFEKSVMPGIKDLVNNQIELIKKETDDFPKFVFLVGGFGRCPYIRDALRDGPCHNRDIQLIQATHSAPWSCVSRGAVQYGANVQPSTRRARYSYGWSSHESFDPERHLIEDRYWDEGRSEYMAANQVHWPIRRGQEIVSGDSSFSYSMTFLQKSQGFYRHNVRVYKSTLQDPPTRISEDRDFGTNDEVADDVVFLGHIALRTPVKIEDLPKFRNAQDKRFPFFEWHWDIRVSGRSVSMTATTSDGDKVGELNINNIMK